MVYRLLHYLAARSGMAVGAARGVVLLALSHYLFRRGERGSTVCHTVAGRDVKKILGGGIEGSDTSVYIFCVLMEPLAGLWKCRSR
jgi:hypothetical protein